MLGLEDAQEIARLERSNAAGLLGGVAAAAAERLHGAIGVTLISIGIVCSTFGAANGNILTGPRRSYAMARDGLFFPRFDRLHWRRITPVFAIAVQGVVGAVYVHAGTFDQLTDSVVFAAWIFYLLTLSAHDSGGNHPSNSPRSQRTAKKA